MSMLLTVLCIARSVVMPEPPLPGHENMLVAAGLTTEMFCPRMILKQQPGNLDSLFASAQVTTMFSHPVLA
ncbi:hypothetical protein HG772_003884 [Salmonella enterica]|nr:hypothetical protein [Salmonella enterica]EGG9437113.1 hypothetical protein [Salmonella enterica]EGU0350410.1 hypothetical protein [Salmonella enterica]EGU1037255.1 hypothetical protein [Salmonella enterica]EGU1062035.1 hypothetical protein [Salmonella enterica]